jgi:hypothetical protein
VSGRPTFASAQRDAIVELGLEQGLSAPELVDRAALGIGRLTPFKVSRATVRNWMQEAKRGERAPANETANLEAERVGRLRSRALGMIEREFDVFEAARANTELTDADLEHVRKLMSTADAITRRIEPKSQQKASEADLHRRAERLGLRIPPELESDPRRVSAALDAHERFMRSHKEHGASSEPETGNAKENAQSCVDALGAV